MTKIVHKHGIEYVVCSACGGELDGTGTCRNDCLEEACIFCGETKGPDGFEDGLRCKVCAEQQDATSA